VAPKVTNGCGSRRRPSVLHCAVIEAELAPRFKSANRDGVGPGQLLHQTCRLVARRSDNFSLYAERVLIHG